MSSSTQDFDPTESESHALKKLLAAFRASLRDGENPDAQSLARELEHEPERQAFLVEALAAQAFEDWGQGRRLELAGSFERLAAEQRERCRQRLMDELVQAFLSARERGDSPTLVGFVAAIDDSDFQRDFRIEAVCADFVCQAESGVEVDVEELFALLPNEEERELCRTEIDVQKAVMRQLHGSLLPNDVLADRFRITRELGRGGMCIVYLADDLQMQRRVALKVAMPRSLVQKQSELEQLLEESRALSSLKSPHIVSVHDVRDGEPPFVVMEHVEGINLSMLLAGVRDLEASHRSKHHGRGSRTAWANEVLGRAPDPDRPTLLNQRSWYRFIAAFAARAARALDKTHTQGFVHGDLKPSNIMVAGGGSPVLVDFSLATSLEHQSDSVRGSMGYFAPEQILEKNAPFDQRRREVYQLGIVLYEALTLESLFPERSHDQLHVYMKKVTGGLFEPPHDHDPHIPQDLVSILLKALETRPADRYADACQFAEDLEAFLARRPLIHHAVSPARQLVGWGRFLAYHRVAHAAALTVVLFVVGYFAYDWWRWRQPDLSAFRFVWAAERPVELGDDSTLSAETDLGVFANGDDPFWVYALEIYCDDDANDEEEALENALVTPLSASLMSREYQEPSEGPLRLSGGDHRIKVSQVPKNPERPWQGFLVLATRYREPILDDWLAGIIEDEKRSGFGGGIPYREALGLLESLREAARDPEANAGLSPEEWKRRYGNMQTDSESEQPIGGLRSAAQLRRIYRVDHE